MIIDIIFAVLIILAIIKGYRRGFIVAVFSFLAIIIGLAAAIKLSTIVADHLGHATKISDKWLPIVSFIIVFIIITLLVRLGANALQKLVESLMLGFFNRLGGIIFYVAIYITVFSILLFYAQQINIIKADTIKTSVTWSFIQPWGPKAINLIGSVIPFFKNMFQELERFFGGLSQKLSLL
jgi:membrane protein required for colicin V production